MSDKIEQGYGAGDTLTTQLNLTILKTLTSNSTSTTLAPNTAVGELISSIYFWVYGVVLTVLTSVGIVTNLLNIYALSKTVRTNKRPMYHCLICMAAVDMQLMVILLVLSIRFYIRESPLVNPSHIFDNERQVPLVDYASYVLYNVWYIPANILMTISNWCTVTMGLFRLVAVFAPLRAASICTIRRAQIGLICVCLFSVLVNLPLILEKRIEKGIFHTNAAYSKFNTISVILTVPLPIATVLVINLLLITRIRYYRAQVKRLFEGQRGSLETDTSGGGVSSSQQTRQAERTLIAISMFYVVTSIPNVVYWLRSYTNLMPNMDAVSINVFYIVANMFIYVNHACNFFFYVLLNKPFRNLLWKKFRKTRDGHHQLVTNTSSLRGDSMKLKRISSGSHVRSRLLEDGNNNINNGDAAATRGPS